MLRDLASSSAADADIVNHVRSGDLIPVEALKRLLKDRINDKTQHGCRKVLVDGFPRRLDQAAAVEEQVSIHMWLIVCLIANDLQIGPPALVLFFHCPEEIAEQRFLTRNLLGRETDDRKTFRKRYQEFTKLNPVIVEAYQRRGILLEVGSLRNMCCTSDEWLDQYRWRN